MSTRTAQRRVGLETLVLPDTLLLIRYRMDCYNLLKAINCKVRRRDLCSRQLGVALWWLAFIIFDTFRAETE